jgi:glycosidase
MSDQNPYQPTPFVKIKHPEWSKNAVIYQINTRQFTQEGTFLAAETHLPRLKALGVDILWLMPVWEIGAVNRKGSLGSPYAIRDYYKINPEFGTQDDFKHFVTAAHEQGMYVILDWVANHTAWDSVLVEQHPEWYARDWKGDFIPTPWEDWEDIIDLDYDQEEVRRYMTEALKYWVREADIDGYRCDVAGFVPTEFWNNARKELDAIKPVFMLAEWENRDLHAEAFDMTYAWSWHDRMRSIAAGKSNAQSLFGFYAHNEKSFPRDGYRMMFVTNHDKNAWDGTDYELFGDALEAVMVFTVVSEGMPLIYNGQEAGNPRRLAFFEKDPIEWREHPQGELYKKLIQLKKGNTALWNGSWGARMVRVANSLPEHVFSFARQNEQDKVFAVFNFSPQAQQIHFQHSLHHGEYRDYFSGETVRWDKHASLALEPWGYRVYEQKA